MSDTTQVPLSTQQDGSLEAALASMPDIEALEASNPDLQPLTRERDRDDGGRYKAKEPQPEAKPETAETEAETPDAAGEDDDDPFVEFAQEDGKEPVREKLSKVLEGYTKAQKLEADLQAAKQSQRVMLPQEVETLVTEVSKYRQGLIQQLQQVANQSKPVPPDLELMNPNSQNYNPELYYNQTQQFLAAKERQAQVAREIQAQQETAAKEQEALVRARMDREWQRIQQVWPEFAASKDSAEKARSELKTAYGFDDETLNSVVDSRFYALAKDALAYRAKATKEAEAVKVVKAKPKLISGIARQNTTAKQRSSADSFKRLQQTGSLEDAAAALDAFL